MRLADGYPYFLQLYADAVWRVAAPVAGSELPLDALDRARVVVDDELDTMFRARWSKASAGERRLLVAAGRAHRRPGVAGAPRARSPSGWA